MQRFAVIMAGGGGTRFWPLSRQHMPKQLLNISGNDVMINETIKRLDEIVPIQNILIVTNMRQKQILYEVLPKELPRENILLEPIGRNTAACIAFAAMVIESRCKSGDSSMCVLPSDHYIVDENMFRHNLGIAFNIAEAGDKLVTIGIKPTFPATGYGYIHRSSTTVDGYTNVYEVDAFTEKPHFDLARKYINNTDYLWNSGMFIWKSSTILKNLDRYLPRMIKAMMPMRDNIGNINEQEVVNQVYPLLPSISIDYGVLERSSDVLVILGDFGWNDVGSWDSLGSIFPTDEQGNIVKAKHIGIDTQNSIIYGTERLITTIGIDNLIIADTQDALLICPKNRAQEVKEIVELINSKGMKEYA